MVTFVCLLGKQSFLILFQSTSDSFPVIFIQEIQHRKSWVPRMGVQGALSCAT